MAQGHVGYKRIIIITIVSTAFIILVDHYGVIDTLARYAPGKG